MSFIDGDSRDQISLLPACIDDYVAPAGLVRVVDAFVASLDLAGLGFDRAIAATGRPAFQPGDMVRLYIGATSIGSDHRDTSGAHASGTSKRLG